MIAAAATRAAAAVYSSATPPPPHTHSTFLEAWHLLSAARSVSGQGAERMSGSGGGKQVL